MCSNIGMPINHHFPFGTNGKVVVLGVPILKHFRVYGKKRKQLSQKYSQSISQTLISQHINIKEYSLEEIIPIFIYIVTPVI